MPPDAVIFDMDGVIVDSELHWKSIEGYFLQTLVPTWGTADQGRITGLSFHDMYSLLKHEYGVGISREELLALYDRMAAEIYRDKVSLMDGFRELPAVLRENGVRVGLASSSLPGWIRIVIERFELETSFDVVVSAEDVNGEGKPSPAIYLHTARALGVEPSRCIVIEDSRNGVLSAKRAGMYCIGFRNGFNHEQDLSAADMIAHGFSELEWEMLQTLL